jgi:DNA-binding transcriptional MerR regulator
VQVKQLRIGKLASQLGLNPKTIRYYESIGLLPDPERTDAGYRLYSDQDVDRLKFILKARAVGLSLSEINDVLTLAENGTQPCEHVTGLLDRKLEQLDAQIAALESLRAEVAALRTEATPHVSQGDGVCRIIEHHRLGDRLSPLDLPVNWKV